MSKKKKVGIIVVVVLILLVGIAFFCYLMAQPLMLGLQPVTFVEATTTKEDVEGKAGYTLYRTEAGEVIDYETSFVQMPIATFMDSPKGTIVEEKYTTDVYEDGKTYEKHCVVYLPHGYDTKDTSKKYNVVYFQHGNNGYPEYLTRDVNLRQLDYMFATGDVEPVILVLVTYYMDDTKTLAGDGDGVLPANYYKEIAEDVIPLIEMKYNTYLSDTNGTLEDIEATREHRAFSGYSRGSNCTWYMFRYNLEYFKYFAPMSYGTCGYEAGSLPSYVADEYKEQMTSDASVDANEKAYQFLLDGIEEHPDKDFFIYVCSGHKNDGGPLREQMGYFTKQTEVFQYGKDIEAGDNIYLSLSEFPHSDDYVPFYFYNSLQVFFQ